MITLVGDDIEFTMFGYQYKQDIWSAIAEVVICNTRIVMARWAAG